MSDPQFKGHIGHCDTHDKRLYTDKSRARQAIRKLKERGMRPYRCDAVEGMWHVGHMAPQILQGHTTAHVYYGRSLNVVPGETT